MVRFANIEDLTRINEIRKQVHKVHSDGRPDVFRSDFNEALENHIYTIWNDQNSDVIVAERNGVICGFSVVSYVTKPLSPYSIERKYYNVVEFGVDENFRRQGIGTELFDFIKEQARDRGFHKIELDMWEFNESALKFYESVGFRTYRRYMDFDF